MGSGNGTMGANAGAPYVASGGGGASMLAVPWAKPQQPNLSFIEDHEQEQAQKLIDDQFRQLTGTTLREHFRLSRYFCAVKIYIRPEEIAVGEDGKHKIILPDEVRSEDRYSSCTGLVCAIAPNAFKDKDGNPRIPTFRIGDWVLFSRTDIIRVDFRGVPLGIMTDDRAIAVVDEPSDYIQGGVTFKS